MVLLKIVLYLWKALKGEVDDPIQLRAATIPCGCLAAAVAFYLVLVIGEWIRRR